MTISNSTHPGWSVSPSQDTQHEVTMSNTTHPGCGVSPSQGYLPQHCVRLPNSPLIPIRELKQTRRRQLTRTLISKTMTLQVHYTCWYISLPSCAQLQREMTKLKVSFMYNVSTFLYLNGNARHINRVEI